MTQNSLTKGYMNEAALQGGVLNEKRIRATVLCVFRRGDSIFVSEGYDPSKNRFFFRPLGGGIEFGERAEDAIVREMREETGLEITNVRYLGVCENIFEYNGVPGHEIVLLYQAEFVDRSIYDLEVMDCEEIDGMPFKSYWKRIDDFRDEGNPPLYPAAILGLLEQVQEAK